MEISRWTASRGILMRFAVGILFLTGSAKILSGLGSARVLIALDPLFGIPFRWLFIAVGTIEVATALYVFFGRDPLRQSLAVVVVTTNMLLYRAGLALIHSNAPCRCLGSLTEAIHIDPLVADRIAKIALVYLTVIGYWLFFIQWRDRMPLAARREVAT